MLPLDYGTVDHDSEPMPCRCGVPTCRRLITGQDWRRPELQQKYGGHFAWFLLGKIRAGPNKEKRPTPKMFFFLSRLPDFLPLSNRPRQHIQVNHRPVQQQRRPDAAVELGPEFLPFAHRRSFRPGRPPRLAQHLLDALRIDLTFCTVPSKASTMHPDNSRSQAFWQVAGLSKTSTQTTFEPTATATPTAPSGYFSFSRYSVILSARFS